jgi:Domain of unknown function (DUF305)
MGCRRPVTLGLAVVLASSFVLGRGIGASRFISASERDAEAPYLAENDAAMRKMMAAMAPAPMGDVDRDFVFMMVPHHQGAIDMAVAVLRYSRNEQIRRLAQEIIVTQQQEIVAMRLAIGEHLPPSAASPTQPALGSAMPAGMIMK